MGEVRGVERAGEEAVLPEVAGAVVFDVEPAGVVVVGAADGAGQGVGAAGDGDLVDVVSHEREAQQAELKISGVGGDERQVDGAILF